MQLVGLKKTPENSNESLVEENFWCLDQKSTAEHFGPPKHLFRSLIAHFFQKNMEPVNNKPWLFVGGYLYSQRIALYKKKHPQLHLPSSVSLFFTTARGRSYRRKSSQQCPKTPGWHSISDLLVGILLPIASMFGIFTYMKTIKINQM